MPIYKSKIVLDGKELGGSSESSEGSSSRSVESEIKHGKLEDDEEDEDREKEKEEALERQLHAMDSRDWAVKADG
jgi:hypothetical protein